MTVQILSIVVVLVVAFFLLRKQQKKDRRYFGKKVEYTAKEKKILEKYRREYQPIKPDKRLSSLENNKWELEDIAKTATEIIYDSPIPGKAEKDSLKPGDSVKLKFMIEEEGEMEVERMWIRVKGEKDGLYFGELDNEPFGSTELIEGQTVWFHANHIFEIDKGKK